MSEMVVPDGWEVKRLGEYVKLQGGNAFKSSEFQDIGVPIVRISNIKGGVVDLSDVVCYQRSSEFNNFSLQKGDVLLAMSGATTGKIGLYKYSAEAYLNQRVGRFLNKSSESIDIGFLYQLVQTQKFTKNVLIDAIGGAQPNISSSQVEGIMYAFPPLPEQQKIASILTSVDEVIEKTQSQINKLQDLKKGTMNELLTKGIGHTEFKDSPVGKIPVEWEVKRLGSVSTVQTGIAKNSKIEAETIEVPYLRVANVQDNYLNLEEIKTIKIIPSKVDRYLLKVGDVLMNEGGDYDKLGRGVVWKGEVSPCVHQNHVFVVRPNHHQLRSEFLNEFSSSEYGKRYFLGCSKQSTNLASINSTQLKDMKVIIPSIDEQKEIIAIASSITKKVELLSAKLEQTQSLKKSLMQDLLTGKVRVTVN